MLRPMTCVGAQHGVREWETWETPAPPADRQTYERRAHGALEGILCVAVKQGRNVLFCMPNRAKCTLVGFSNAPGTKPAGDHSGMQLCSSGAGTTQLAD
jgi:hypothetical protein